MGSYLLMGDELGSATGIDRLVASSGLSIPIFTLNGKIDFLIFYTDFEWKMSPKNWRFWVVLDVSTRSSRIRKLFGPAYAPLFDGQCVQFASFNFALVDENRLQAALSAFWLVQLVQESCFSWPNPLTINKNARSTTTTIDAGIIPVSYTHLTLPTTPYV